MNIKRILPLLAFAFAALAAVGVLTFAHPCIHDDGSFGACFWAGRAVIGTAAVTAVLALAAAFVTNDAMRKGILLSSALTSLLGVLIPGGLINLCSMASMHCRAVMRPAVTICFCITAVLSAAGMLASSKREQNG